MIAFHLFGRPVYRYGIFYGITFLFGYRFLSLVGQQSWIKSYKGLARLLGESLDTFVFLTILGVIVGGRLGHVFLYDRMYYSQHLGEIVQTWDGGMSFIGGVIGVIMVLVGIGFFYKLTRREFLLLGDLVLCVVPVGILLGRIGNFLNKELYGLAVYPLEVLPSLSLTDNAWWVMREQTLFLKMQARDFFRSIGLIHNYQIDTVPTFRINTNIIQAFGEGMIPLIVGQLIFWGKYVRGAIRPGFVSGLFFVVYGIVRFFAEYLKELPISEYYGILSISQWIMIGFFVGGMLLISIAQRQNDK